MRLETSTDRRLVPAGRSCRRYVVARYVAPEAAPVRGRAPLSVALVLDRSGSMQGEKIRLAREATRMALGMLRENDRFSLVVYDEHIEVLASGEFATRPALDRARARLDEIDARGMTDLGGGYLAGCRSLAEALRPGEMGRCLILTDGLANHGEVRRDVLADHARELKARGLVTSTFGVGEQFDETLLQRMAEAGGGNYYFLARPADIPEMLTSEMDEALEIVARDVHLEVEVGPGASVTPVSADATESLGYRARVRVGDLVSRQRGEVVFAVNFHGDRPGTRCPVHVRLVGADGHAATALRGGDWLAVEPREAERERPDREAGLAAVSAVDARARRDALELNRAGRYREAEEVLRRASDEIRAILPDDPETERFMLRIQDEAPCFAAEMAAPMMKARHFEAYTRRRGRDLGGKAERA